MQQEAALREKIFRISNEPDFISCALEVFRYQARECEVYSRFIRNLQINPAAVSRIEDIPFLPISFFKTHPVTCGTFSPEAEFQSSGTTGESASKHLVKDITLYEESFRKVFSIFYGNVRDYCILALLPSYLERAGSSLVYMTDKLISDSQHPESGFYLYEHQQLENKLKKLSEENAKVLLIGVSFALLDFTEGRKLDLSNTILMETGGMKGRRKEIIREELHSILKERTGVENIHSEYGMTELLSQAYSSGDGLFSCPPWMKLMTRETTDPFTQAGVGQTGGINVIDLANLYSCSFIATQDLGRMFPDGKTEILGRFDNSDIRGCSLMV